MTVSYTLDSGVERHAETPDTFQIPPQADRENLKPGDLAKIIFRIEIGDDVYVERMWVKLSEVRPEFYVGLLDNDPYCTDELRSGMRVEFHADHVIQISRVA